MWAQDLRRVELHWSLSGGTLTISGSGAMPNYVSAFGTLAPWSSYRTSITNVVIKEGVTTIGSFAFYDCSKLISITIPSSVTSIEYGTFQNCSSLISIAIPNSVTFIGYLAFDNCSSLTSITIPNSVTKKVQENLFRGCTNLKSISLPLNIYSGNYFGGLFYESTSPTTPTGYEFQMYDNGSRLSYFVPSSLKEVNITDDATIKPHFFDDCTNLTKIVAPNTNAVAFNRCTRLDTLIIGNLTGGGFYPTLKYFAITDGKSTTLQNGCLGGASNLTDLTLPFIGTSPTTPTTLGTLFGFNDSNSNSNVPTTLKKLTLVRTSNNIKIADNALSGLPQLTELTLSSNVQEVGREALSGCSGLKSIYSNWTYPPTAYNNSTFQGVNKFICKLYVPVGSKQYYSVADGWKEFFSPVDNIEEEAPVTITVRSVPLYGGEVSGLLQYNYDDNASITANSNMGYDFQGWMENDNIVSTNRTYTFPVEGARTLYAVFTPRENDNTVNVSSSSPTEAVISWDGEDGASSYTLIVYSDAARTHEYARFEFNADGTLRARGISTSASRFSQTVDNLIAGQQYYYTVTAYDSENYKLSMANGNFTAGSNTGVVETQCNASLRVIGYYSLSGQKLPREPQSGIYITRYDNGTAEKVIK